MARTATSPRNVAEAVSDHVVKAREQRLRLGARLSFDRRRHERGRGFGDRTAFPEEADVGDAIVVDLEPERELVAAHRVPPLDLRVGALHRPEVPWRAVVVENQALIEIVEARHHPKTRFTDSSPPTSTSISSAVL